MYKLDEYKIALDSLSIYRGILKDEVIKNLYALLTSMNQANIDINEIITLYSEFYYKLMEASNGCGLRNYIIGKILSSENIFSKASQNTNFEELQKELTAAVARDLSLLQMVASFSKEVIVESFKDNTYLKRLVELPDMWEQKVSEGKTVIEFINSISWDKKVKNLWDFHNTRGVGIFSRYNGFVWEGDVLHGVVSLDPIRLEQLVNYDRQKEIVVNNTKALLKGYKANNVLLYGSRGTGKSSTVKALLNEFSKDGLRVIEIPKQYLQSFPKLIRIIKQNPLKFILFIDDLAFEDSEETYTALKAILEGGLETKPDNVVIYATSNRRHLVKEKFSDRDGLGGSYAQDEIHAADSMEEKLSLADRFGITVTYIHPNQKEYISIVDTLANQRGITLPEEDLHRRALQWAMSYNGRSPRTARQFIDSLESE